MIHTDSNTIHKNLYTTYMHLYTQADRIDKSKKEVNKKHLLLILCTHEKTNM